MADIFIKFEGVDGESTQKGFEKWIEVQSFSMSSHTSGSTAVGTGSGVGKPTIDGVHFMTIAGRHTPKISQKYFKGDHFPTVEVKFIKQTGADAAETYYHLKMQKVFVTSMQMGKGTDTLGSEQMALTAEIYEQTYWAQDANGNLQKVDTTTYDAKQGVSS